MESRVLIGTIEQFPEGRLHKARVGRQVLVVGQSDGQFFALENRCPHLGWSMAGGKVENGAAVCPWHHSRFNVQTGACEEWVVHLRGIRLPRWVRPLVRLGRAERAARPVRLERDGDDLYAWLD